MAAVNPSFEDMMQSWKITKPQQYPVYFGSIAAMTLLAGVIYWNADDTREAASRDVAEGAKSEQVAAVSSNQNPAMVDYSRLKPSDFVVSLSSFGANPSYAEARLLTYCGHHAKTRGELDDAENKKVIQGVDSTGQYLKQLEFERRVADEQWAAAGFMDTLLRWKMKLEVVYGNEATIQPGVQA